MVDFVRRLLKWGEGDVQSWIGHSIIAAAIVTLSAPLVGVVAGVWAAVLHLFLREVEQDLQHKTLDSVLDYLIPMLVAGLSMTGIVHLGFWVQLLFVTASFVAWVLWFFIDVWVDPLAGRKP